MSDLNHDDMLVLDDKERSVINEYDAAIAEISSRKNGALQMVIRQHNLVGNWRYENGMLLRMDADPPVSAPMPVAGNSPNGNK